MPTDPHGIQIDDPDVSHPFALIFVQPASQTAAMLREANAKLVLHTSTSNGAFQQAMGFLSLLAEPAAKRNRFQYASSLAQLARRLGDPVENVGSCTDFFWEDWQDYAAKLHSRLKAAHDVPNDPAARAAAQDVLTQWYNLVINDPLREG